MRRTLPTLLLIAGTVVPAITASGDARAVDVLPTSSTTTTTTAPTTTTTSSTTTSTATTLADEPEAGDGTTTTTAPGATATEEATSDTEADGGGGLSISVPGAADLSPGTSVGAGSLSGPLGPVTVTDERGGLLGSWTASVTATDFVTGDATEVETIPSSSVAYWSGPATEVDGLGTFSPGQLTALEAQALSAPLLAFARAGAGGDSSVTWVPTIIVSFPPTAPPGQYVGTITHSVA